MTLTIDRPDREHAGYETVEYHDASTMGAPANVPPLESATSFSSKEELSELENRYRVLQRIIALRNMLVHSTATVAELEDNDESLSRLIAWVDQNQQHGDEIEGGVTTVKRHRKILFSESVDISNLPKRRRSIPRLGPEDDDE